MVQFARLDRRRQQVGLTVADARVARRGRLARLLGEALIALHPAYALPQTSARRIALLRLARPGPGVAHPERLSPGHDHLGRMQVEPALGLVRQRPQPPMASPR